MILQKEGKMEREKVEEIREFVEHYEKMGNAYFWHSFNPASVRRWYEEKNTKYLNFEYEGKKYEAGVEVSCSCRHIYANRYVKVNNEKKDIRELKKVLKSLEEKKAIEV